MAARRSECDFPLHPRPCVAFPHTAPEGREPALPSRLLTGGGGRPPIALAAPGKALSLTAPEGRDCPRRCGPAKHIATGLRQVRGQTKPRRETGLFLDELQVKVGQQVVARNYHPMLKIFVYRGSVVDFANFTLNNVIFILKGDTGGATSFSLIHDR